MDVVVSGSHGLIGSALVDALNRGGHRVRRLVRGTATGDVDIGWDPEEGRIDAPALEGVGAVVHLAGEGIGEKRWTEDQKRRIRESRVRGTALLAGAIASREQRASVFVSGSAIGYYGDRGNEILTETSTPGSDFLAEVVRAWEAEATPVADAGIRTVFLRSGIVLDPHGGVLKRLVLPFSFGLGGRVGSGDQWMSWIALQDEVGTILHAIDNPDVSGPMNATAPNPTTNAVLTRTLGKVLQRPTILPTPLMPLRIRYGRELVDTLLLSSQRVLPEKLAATGYTFRQPTLEDALRAMLERSGDG